MPRRCMPLSGARWAPYSGARIGRAWLSLALAIAPALAAAPPSGAATMVSGAASADDAARSEMCARMVHRFEAAFAGSASKPPVPRLAALRRAARQAGEDPAGCVRDRILAIERGAREQLVGLVADGVRLPAGAVYSCGRIEPDLHCQGWQADDSAHRGELAAPAAVPGGGRLRVSFAPAYHPRRIRAYLALRGGHEPQPLVIARRAHGALPLPEVTGEARIVLVVQETSGGAFVKYVWWLHFSDKP